jgi:hypothetical protein
MGGVQRREPKVAPAHDREPPVAIGMLSLCRLAR